MTIQKDIQRYAERNWRDYLDTITEISKCGNTGNSLVESEKEIYNFDKICSSLSPAPASADGLSISMDTLKLIEFKSGFKQRITKENFSEEKGTCPNSGRVCADYWRIFFKNQKKNISELKTSIRSKAVESYITIEKYILPQCDDLEMQKTIQIHLIVVVDADDIDNMENTYAELASRDDAQDNCLIEIKQALSRLKKRQNDKKFAYDYYDTIEVMSAQDFSNRLRMQEGLSEFCVNGQMQCK